MFPSGSDLQLRREARTGSWRDINTGGPTTAITRRYLTMWLDHGTDPAAATYSYLVLHKTLTMVNFWQPDRVADLEADTPFSVIRRISGREIQFAISDPTQLATTVQLQVHLPGLRVTYADAGITTRRSFRSTEVIVDVTGAAGASRYLTMRF